MKRIILQIVQSWLILGGIPQIIYLWRRIKVDYNCTFLPFCKTCRSVRVITFQGRGCIQQSYMMCCTIQTIDAFWSREQWNKIKHNIERQGSRGEREQLNVFSPRPVGQTCGLNLASLCGDQLQNTKTTRQSKQCKILRGSLTEGAT